MKARIVRKVANGVLAVKLYTDPAKYQFLKHEYWRDHLGGPRNVVVGDEYTLRDLSRGGPNWQLPLVRKGQLYNIGNAGSFGETLIWHDHSRSETLKINSGHVICLEGNNAFTPVSDWQYDPEQKTRLMVTPYGFERAKTYSGSTDMFAPSNETDWLDQFFDDNEDNQS